MCPVGLDVFDGGHEVVVWIEFGVGRVITVDSGQSTVLTFGYEGHPNSGQRL